MSESVIFNSPFLLTVYLIALILSLVGINKRTGFLLPILSALIVAGASLYALLLGASVYELAIVLLTFLLINLKNVGRDSK